MSILAEPRTKQKISVDPQNLQWKNDDQKLSKKLMEKMGWNDGDGLGKSRQGNADAVKLKANYGNKGLGADKLASYDTTWIAHHDDFADILSALNKNKEQPVKDNEESEERVKKMSIELSSKSMKRRIHYQKFTRAKDTSNLTDKERSAIMGVGLKHLRGDTDHKEKDVNKEQGDKKEGSADSAPNTTVSNVSVGDYFAAKMAAFKNKQKAAAVEVKEEEPEFEIKQEVEIKKELEDEIMETPEEERRRRKREKKEAKRRALEIVSVDIKEEVIEEEQVVIKEEVVDETEEERAACKAQRKEEKRIRKEAKKRAFEMDEEEIAEETAHPEEPSKKRRKMKEE